MYVSKYLENYAAIEYEIKTVCLHLKKLTTKKCKWIKNIKTWYICVRCNVCISEYMKIID